MAQVWLITGSARGLGRAIAEAVLAAGDKLIATARHPQQLSDLVERYGDHVRAVALDVTDERAAIAAVRDQRHDHRARALPHGLRGILPNHSRGQSRLCLDGRSRRAVSARVRWRAARRPEEGGGGRPEYRASR